MNTTETVTRINEYIEAECAEIKSLYDICAESSLYRDYPPKAMIDSLDVDKDETLIKAFGESQCLTLMKPFEDLSKLHELMGFMSGFKVALKMKEWDKTRASEI